MKAFRALFISALLIGGLSWWAFPQTINILSPTGGNPVYRDQSNCSDPVPVRLSWSNMPPNCSFRIESIRIGPITDGDVGFPTPTCPPPSGSATFLFDESLCSLTPGQYDLTVSGTYIDPVTGRETVVFDTEPRAVIIQGAPAPADLSVSKSSDVSEAREGDPVLFTIVASNAGPNDATGVVVMDRLPVGLKYVSHSCSVGTYEPASGRWSIGNLPRSGQATLTLRSQVQSGTTGQTLVNRADISGNEPDPVGNNTDSASVRVVGPGERQADLSVTKAADQMSVQEGDVVVFTILATNRGPDNATGVTVHDKLPPELVYRSHSVTVGTYDPTTGDWSIDRLPCMTGEETRLVIETEVQGVASTSITNTATIQGEEADPNGANNRSVVVLKVLVRDSDGDGLPDPQDPCPTDPDCDDDGLQDGEDPCPTDPDCDDDGLQDGEDPCPTDPDCDDDGLQDGEDPCPTDPDCDDDGVIDPQDPCPQTPGVFCSGISPQVVISEIAWAGTFANPQDQWIELENVTDADLALDGWVLVITSPDGAEASATLSGTIPARGFYLIERGGDHVVNDIKADHLVLPLLSRDGGTVRLVNPDGWVVDVANLEGGPWPAGLALAGLVASMERVNPGAPGTKDNWRTNNTIKRNGLDGLGYPINGTPKEQNSCR